MAKPPPPPKTPAWGRFYSQVTLKWKTRVATSSTADQKVLNAIKWIKETKKRYTEMRVQERVGDKRSKCYIVWKIKETKCYQGSNKENFRNRKECTKDARLDNLRCLNKPLTRPPPNRQNKEKIKAAKEKEVVLD